MAGGVASHQAENDIPGEKQPNRQLFNRGCRLSHFGKPFVDASGEQIEVGKDCNRKKKNPVAAVKGENFKEKIFHGSTVNSGGSVPARVAAW